VDDEFPTTPLHGTTVADLAWFTGVWSGHRGPDAVQEAWHAPAGGTMMGMFRWVRGEVPFLYELTVLEPEQDTVTMKIKHFSAGLIGWEDKERCVRFVLVALSDKQAVFRQQDVDDPPWMVYRLGTDTMDSFFQRPGEVVADEQVFRMRRVE